MGQVENEFRMQSNLEKLEEWPGQPGIQMAERISVDVGTVNGECS